MKRRPSSTWMEGTVSRWLSGRPAALLLEVVAVLGASMFWGGGALLCAVEAGEVPGHAGPPGHTEAPQVHGVGGRHRWV